MGDIHGGTIHCNEKKLREKIREIAADPVHNLVIGMGDDVDAITPGDKRWDSRVISDWVTKDNIAEDETNWIVGVQHPVAGQMVAKLFGNHEDTLRKHLHTDIHRNICNRLGVPSGGYTCYIRLTFKRNKSNESHTFTILASHGAGAAITKGAKMNRLQRFMDSFDADMYLHGHVHDIITDTKPYIVLSDTNHIKQRVRVGAMTGSWVTSYTEGVGASYAEVKNYPPSVLGCPRFVICPNEGTIDVQLN